jgi:hypothetical protein
MAISHRLVIKLLIMNIKVGNIIKEKMLHSTGYLTWKWSHTIERQYSKCGLK